MLRREYGSGSLLRRKGCRYWYAQFYNAAGIPIRVSTKMEGKKEAQAELRRLMGDSERGIPQPNNKLKYGDIRPGLIANYIEKGNKSLRVLADGSESIVGLRQLDSYCGYVAATPGKPGIKVAMIDTDFVREFVKKRLAEGVGTAMVNRSLQCLRRMLNIAKEDNKIAVVPKIRLQKEPRARKGFLPREKFDELVAALPVHLRPLITFLYYCGVRVGEALQVDWAQVDLNAALIRLEAEQTKTDEARIVPMPNVLLALLQPVEPKTGLVFDSTNLRTEWEKACAAVGQGTRVEHKSGKGNKWHHYEGLIPHDLRRSAIRNLRLANVPESVAMEISGHKTREVFRRYDIKNTEDVSAAMRAVESAAPNSAKLVQSAPRRQHKILKA